MEYEKFKEEFEQSGLSQKAYASLKGISPSMVSYYLKKCRELKEETRDTAFRKVEVVSSISKHIIISTEGGLKIEIPL